MKKTVKVVLAVLLLCCTALFASCGKSSYELAQKAGFTGTEEQWNAILSDVGNGVEVTGSTSRYEYTAEGVRELVTDVTLSDGTVKTYREPAPVKAVAAELVTSCFYEFPEGKSGELLLLVRTDDGKTSAVSVTREMIVKGEILWNASGTYPVRIVYDGLTVDSEIEIESHDSEDVYISDVTPCLQGAVFAVTEDADGNLIADTTEWYYRTYNFSRIVECAPITPDMVSRYDETYLLLDLPSATSFYNTKYAYYKVITLAGGETLSDKVTDMAFTNIDNNGNPHVYLPIGAETPFSLGDRLIHILNNDGGARYFTTPTLADLAEEFSSAAAGTTTYHFKNQGTIEVEGELTVTIYDPANPDPDLFYYEGCELVTPDGDDYYKVGETVLIEKTYALKTDSDIEIRTREPLTADRIVEGEADFTTPGIKIFHLTFEEEPEAHCLFAWDDTHNVRYAEYGEYDIPAISVGDDPIEKLLEYPLVRIEYIAPVDGQEGKYVPLTREMIAVEGTTEKEGVIKISVSCENYVTDYTLEVYGETWTLYVSPYEINEDYPVVAYVGGREDFLDALIGTEIDFYCANDRSGRTRLTAEMLDISAVDFTKRGLCSFTINCCGNVATYRVLVLDDDDDCFVTDVENYDPEYCYAAFEKTDTPPSVEDFLAECGGYYHYEYYYVDSSYNVGRAYLSADYLQARYFDDADFSAVDFAVPGTYQATLTIGELTVPYTVYIYDETTNLESVYGGDVLLPLNGTFDDAIFAPLSVNFFKLYGGEDFEPAMTAEMLDMTKVNTAVVGCYQTTVTYGGKTGEATVYVYDPAVVIYRAYPQMSDFDSNVYHLPYRDTVLASLRESDLIGKRVYFDYAVECGGNWAHNVIFDTENVADYFDLTSVDLSKRSPQKLKLRYKVAEAYFECELNVVVEPCALVEAKVVAEYSVEHPLTMTPAVMRFYDNGCALLYPAQFAEFYSSILITGTYWYEGDAVALDIGAAMGLGMNMTFYFKADDTTHTLTQYQPDEAKKIGTFAVTNSLEQTGEELTFTLYENNICIITGEYVSLTLSCTEIDTDTYLAYVFIFRKTSDTEVKMSIAY